LCKGARERTPIKAGISIPAELRYFSGVMCRSAAEAPATAAHYLMNLTRRLNLPVRIEWSRSPANFRRRAKECGAFQAGFFMRSKETTAAQQADMAIAIKVHVTADVNGGELGPLR
jgi:hypothetical protein